LERKLQQRLVGILVLAAFILLIAPVLLDAEGRIPEQITHIPPQPKKPDMSHLSQLALPVQAPVQAPVQTPVQAPIDAPAQATVEPSVAQATVEPSVDAPMRSAELDAVNAAVDTPALPAVTAAPASRLWSVQVASFREVGKANVLRDRLRAEQFETYVREKLLSDGTLFTQVFVGPVPNRQVADRLNGLVMTKFSLQGLIVRYRE
jgi:DedD protein